MYTTKSLELFTFLKPEMWYTHSRFKCSPNRIKTHTADRFISDAIVAAVAIFCFFSLLFANFFLSLTSHIVPHFMLFLRGYSASSEPLLTHFNICIFCTFTSTTYDRSTHQTSLTLIFHYFENGNLKKTCEMHREILRALGKTTLNTRESVAIVF